ncbi:MAG: hypothetical protein KAQ98_13590 [Bacteriovoracaceae bacterium]|nr:hypothetical protein [Bacteriovoracaceae bacterium]
MKKILLLALILTAYSQTASAIYLRNCYNHGQEFSNLFEYCVNDNFWTIEREIDDSVYLSDCNNFGNTDVSYMFEHCINQNFQKIKISLNTNVFIYSCYNDDMNGVSLSYVNCVNNNFYAIERSIGF